MKKSMLVMMILNLMLISQGFAKGEATGAGVRGGGQFVRVGGGRTLRDLVDPSVCEWTTGRELSAQYAPGLTKSLEKLSTVDWYFAESLRSTINDTPICLTTDLMRIWDELPESVIKEWPKNKIQGAVYVFDEEVIYLDFPRYKALNVGPKGRSQGYVHIHEAIHQYLSHDLFDRQGKLMSIVKHIFLVETTSTMTAEKFALAMEKNGLDFPAVWKARDLAPYREAITILLEDPAFWDLSKLNEAELLELAKQLDGLAPGHLLNRHAMVEFRIPLLREEIEKALASGLGGAAMTPAEWLTWSTSAAGQQSIKDLFAQLATKKVSVKAKRLVSNEPLQMFGVENIVTEISHNRPERNQYWARINAKIRYFDARVAEAVRDGQWDWIKKEVTEKDAFYEAYGTVSLFSGLNSLDAPVPHEKDVAREVLTFRFESHLKAWIKQIQDIAGDTNVAQFESMIHHDKLGY